MAHFAQRLTTSRVERLFKLNEKSGMRLPVIDTIGSNSCVPLLWEKQYTVDLTEELFAAMNVAKSQTNKKV